jgi:hypothetical protein
MYAAGHSPAAPITDAIAEALAAEEAEADAEWAALCAQTEALLATPTRERRLASGRPAT